MLQDISVPFDNAFRPVPPKGEEPVLCFDRGSILLTNDGDGFSFPRAKEFDKGKLTWLFRVGEEEYFLFSGEEKPELPGFSYEPLRSLRGREPRERAFAAFTGRHLHYWYTHARFCGACGAKNVPSQTERAMVCPACGSVYYPVIAPAVIIGVTKGDRLLVSRYANRPYKALALIAGYTEIGETIEDTVRREVMEEVGIHVKNLRYYRSQPWGIDHDVLMGFFCEADGDEELKVEHGELAEAWFASRDELTDLPDNASLTIDMITRFRDGGPNWAARLYEPR